MTTRLLRASFAALLIVIPSPRLAVAASNPPLAEAARQGDSERLKTLLRQSVDVNAAGPDGTTALHWAVYRDDVEMARQLVAAGARVNASNRYGVPPLALACTNGSQKMAALLLTAGADANAAPAGEPVLLTAARTGNIDVVDMLLAHGADVNARDSWRGQTALMWAAVEDHPAVVDLLLRKGADARTKSTGGYSALLFAVRQGHLAIVQRVVAAGGDVNEKAPNGTPALTTALENLRYPVATFLIEQGADPNAVNRQGEAALHAAVRSRAPTLRRRGADDPESLAVIGRLIDHGGNPNGRTPKAPKITDAMVTSAQRPAIDNVINLGGATPFLLAAQFADLSAMRLMLARGADPRLATYENTTTLAMAAGVGFVEGSVRARPESDALAAAKLLIDAGVDVNAVSERGQTALHGAVYRAANEIIRLLVNAGARTDVKDELGRTPLQLAETGFNQVSSVIRRESSATLLRSLSGGPSSVGR
jgi:ankyrin repeat protein